jgi:hypothetical protein
MLKSESCYIYVGTNEVYTWIGSKSPVINRKYTHAIGKKIANMLFEKNNSFATYCKVIEKGEPIIFQEKFTGFPKQLLIATSKSETKGNIAQKVEIKPADVKKMYDYSPPKKDNLLVGIDASIKIFIIDMNQHEKVEYPTHMYGHFYSKDAYIVQYTYKKTQDGKEFNTLYFWQGRDTKKSTQGTSAYKTVELSDGVEMSKQIRVEQGKEPLDFIQLFKFKLIIHKGAFNNEKPQYGKFFEIRSDIDSIYQDSAYAIELDSFSSYFLNPNHCYVLRNENKVYNWTGYYSTKNERLTMESVSKILCFENEENIIIEQNQNEENEEFLKLLNSDVKYFDYEEQKKIEKRNIEGKHIYIPKLFKCSDELHGVPEITDVYEFNQIDIESNWVYILDCVTNIFIWVGSTTDLTKNLKKYALETAIEYSKLIETNENVKPMIRMVNENQEPIEFTCNFFAWRSLKKRKFTTFDQLSIGEEIYEKLSKKFYNIKELDRKNLPEGVDASKLEDYLEDEEFEKVFGMKREQYNSLQNWKKEDLKKKFFN